MRLAVSPNKSFPVSNTFTRLEFAIEIWSLRTCSSMIRIRLKSWTLVYQICTTKARPWKQLAVVHVTLLQRWLLEKDITVSILTYGVVVLSFMPWPAVTYLLKIRTRANFTRRSSTAIIWYPVSSQKLPRILSGKYWTLIRLRDLTWMIFVLTNGTIK